MMFRPRALAAGVALALGLGITGAAQAAPAITFSFNPAGNGVGSGLVTGAGFFDEAPGNVLAVNGSPNVIGFPATPGSLITDFYQANLNSVATPGNVNLFSNGSVVNAANRFFTVVAGFGEQILPFPFTAGATAAFTFDPTNPTNFFKVYANTSAVGSDLNGTGFTGGTLILSGSIVAVDSSSTVQPSSIGAGPSLVSCGLLDQSPDGNQRGTSTSICSGGSANVTAMVSFVNANYFPDLLVGGEITTAITNSSLITPYNQVNPSLAFSSDGITSANLPDAVGNCNGCTGAGNGPNFEFQADGNTSFQRTAPEPGTLTLLGIALAGLGSFARRRKQ
jgi:hypothetical protein